jgi:hypothetical protein
MASFLFFSEFGVRHNEFWIAWPTSVDTVYTKHLRGYKQHKAL